MENHKEKKIKRKRIKRKRIRNARKIRRSVRNLVQKKRKMKMK